MSSKRCSESKSGIKTVGKRTLESRNNSDSKWAVPRQDFIRD